MQKTPTVVEPEGEASKVSGSLSLPKFDFMDTQKALYYCANSTNLVLKLINRFAKEQLSFIKQLNELIASQDVVASKRMVHSLKSNAASLGLDQVANLSAKIERSFNQDINKSEQSQDIKLLDVHLNEVIAGFTLLDSQDTACHELQKNSANEAGLPLPADVTLKKIKQLLNLLKSSDSGSIELCAELCLIANVKLYRNELRSVQNHIDEFEFDKAQEVLLPVISDIESQLR